MSILMTKSKINEILKHEGLRLQGGLSKLYAEGTDIQINEALKAVVDYKAPVTIKIIEHEDDGYSAIAEIIYHEQSDE